LTTLVGRIYTSWWYTTRTHLERGLQVVLVALGEELVGIGRGSVLVEVFQVLQVGAEVLLTVAAGAGEDELGPQLGGGGEKSLRSHLCCCRVTDCPTKIP